VGRLRLIKVYVAIWAGGGFFVNLKEFVMHPISLSSVAPPVAPQFAPDQRPAADAAVMARDTRPYVAMTIAPTPVAGLSQTAAVSRSNVAASAESLELAEKAVVEIDRTLKPYGVTMLPNGKPDTPATFPAPPVEDVGPPTPPPDKAEHLQTAA
jgi:hypothetical protein